MAPTLVAAPDALATRMEYVLVGGQPAEADLEIAAGRLQVVTVAPGEPPRRPGRREEPARKPRRRRLWRRAAALVDAKS